MSEDGDGIRILSKIASAVLAGLIVWGFRAARRRVNPEVAQTGSRIMHVLLAVFVIGSLLYVAGLFVWYVILEK